MNWYKKAQLKTMENIVFDIYSEIMKMGGSWTVLEDKNMMKTYKMQSYRIMHFDGKNIVKTGDYFWVEVKMFILKGLNILHPYDGTYENAQNWQQGVKSSLKEIAEKQNRWPKEEEQKRWEALERIQPENASAYDEQYGNKLIAFDVLVYGKKPDGKEPPNKVNKIEIFFGQGDLEQISTVQGIDTPLEIGQYVKNIISTYYGENNNDNYDNDFYPQPNNPLESINYEPQLVSV